MKMHMQLDDIITENHAGHRNEGSGFEEELRTEVEKGLTRHFTFFLSIIKV